MHTRACLFRWLPRGPLTLHEPLTCEPLSRARTCLFRWLPKELPEHASVVVSTLPDDAVNEYGILPELQAQLEPEDFVEARSLLSFFSSQRTWWWRVLCFGLVSAKSA